MDIKFIEDNIESHIESFNNLKKDNALLKTFLSASGKAIEVIKNGNKIFFAGNGGSASDAQHASAELVVRFNKNRIAVAAIALGTNTAIATAISNDFGYEYIFSRQLEALAKKNDIVIGISTSGNSISIVNLLSKAKEIGCITIGFTGQNGGKMNEFCDFLIKVPSTKVATIQELHGFLLHLFCQIIEDNLFNNN
ncbi:MAG TPA: SIS domain-containing protein [Exilispira sp.]|nr:SIS domain-containing protein [Exilispira sp.]